MLVENKRAQEAVGKIVASIRESHNRNGEKPLRIILSQSFVDRYFIGKRVLEIYGLPVSIKNSKDFEFMLDEG